MDGDYAGEPVDTLILDAHSRPGAVEISRVEVRVRDAAVQGQGVWNTQGSLAGTFAFQDVNPARLPWWQAPKEMPDGLLAGTAKIQAHRAKPRPDVAAVVELAESRFGKLAIHGGTLRIQSSPEGAVSVDSSFLELPGATVALHGVLASDRSLGGIHGTIFDLHEFNPLLRPLGAEAGTGRVEARLAGTIDAPTFVSQGDLFGARLTNGLACDTMTVEAQGRLLPKLDLTGDVGARGLSVGSRALGNLDVTVSGGERLTIERYRQSLGDTLVTLHGVLSFASGGFRADLDSLAVHSGIHNLRNRGRVSVSSLEDHVRVEHLAFDLDPGVLEADIDWDPKGSTIDARGKVTGLDLARVQGFRDSTRARIGGWVEGEFQASGRIEDPIASISVRVDRPAWNGIVGDSLAVDINYVPGVLTVDRAEWVAGKSRASIAGTVRPRFTIEDLTKALEKHDPSWASRATLALEGTVGSFDLGLLAPVDTTLRTLQGEATLRVRATGTAAAPVLDLDVRAPTVGFRGVTGELVGLRMSYKDRRLQIGRCDVRQGEAISKVSGEIPIDLGLYAKERLSRTDPLSLSLRVPGGDLGVLPVLFPEIASASGRITATADVKGTARKPTVTGNVKLVDGKLRLAGRDEIIEGIELDAVFDQERLQITKMTARQGKKGSLSGTGWWRWPTVAPAPYEPPAIGPRGDYAFKIKATDFTTTDRLNYLFRLTGSLDIVNARNPAGAVVPSITGNVTIDKGELTIDLSKPAGEPGEPLPILYNINIDIPGNVFYRTLDAEVELESDGIVIFKNEGEGDLALGILNVRGGKYYILTRQFRNLQGTVNFNSPDRIDPEVNISADTTIPDPQETHTVYLALSDRVSRLKVRVYDDKGTSPNDLWKALALGQFAPSAGVSVNTTENTPGVALPISNYLFQNLEHVIGGTGFVDTIDLRSGASAQASGGSTSTSSSSPVSMVGVGKYVTPDLYLKYARDFSGTGEEQINADYRFTRHLLLKGQQINRKASSTGTQDAQEYSIDLKVRLEY